MNHSIRPFRPVLTPSTSLFGIFHIECEGKHSSLQLSWIVHSRSISVTCTSMGSYNRSVGASHAKCMFWLFIVLKDYLFPERIWNVLSVIQKWCLNSYCKYLGMVYLKMKWSVKVIKLLCMKQVIKYQWCHHRNRHLALIRATVIQHPPF